MLTAPGGLDPTFGTGGKVVTTITGTLTDSGQAAALQSDGKIVTIGSAGNPGVSADFALSRTNPDGSLDTTFGNGGRVVTHFAASSSATGVVIQPDRKIVVAGSVGTYTFSSSFAVARYSTDGSLDTTFGNAGTVTTDFAGGDGTAAGVALQADGKIIVVGSTVVNSSTSFALARYNADGTLDTLRRQSHNFLCGQFRLGLCRGRPSQRRPHRCGRGRLERARFLRPHCRGSL